MLFNFCFIKEREGGMGDFVGFFDTMEIIQEFIEKNRRGRTYGMYYNMMDLETGIIYYLRQEDRIFVEDEDKKEYIGKEEPDYVCK